MPARHEVMEVIYFIYLLIYIYSMWVYFNNIVFKLRISSILLFLFRQVELYMHED